MQGLASNLLGLGRDGGFCRLSLLGRVELFEKVACIALAGRLLEQAGQLLAFGALARFGRA